MARLLLALLLTASVSHAADVDKSIRSSLDLMQKSANAYISKRTCFSCHHQALPALTMGEARKHGIAVDQKMARAQSDFAIAYFTKRLKQLPKGSGVPGGAYHAGYALLALHADQWKADKVTDALVAYLLKKQRDNGQWLIFTKRPPMEFSPFSATALSVQGLALYARGDAKAKTEDAIASARRWLFLTKAKTNEDRTFRLLGLHWSKSGREDINAAAKEILESQRKDGGWAQLEKMASDPYATGQAMVALMITGSVKRDSAAYLAGAEFLLKSQLPDGSWRVESRSRPFQTYFESGYPHKKAQWISMAAAAWATRALILSAPAKEQP